MAVFAAEFWRWQAHPEIWAVVIAMVGYGLYVSRVIEPKMVAAGEAPITSRQKAWFVAGVAVLWLGTDWPVHDVAERYLYSVHMFQHMVLTFLVAPMLLLATPAWLARLVLGDGVLRKWVARLSKPVVAGLIFNVFAAVSHWSAWVNLSTSNGTAHYAQHALIFGSALLMWVPVAGPLPELRISPPGQMAYLFLMSVIPTVPAAWLTFAEGALYGSYDIPDRMWGLSVAHDQQIAGLLMKIGGGLFLWTVITVLFARWSLQEQGPSNRFRGKLVSAPE